MKKNRYKNNKFETSKSEQKRRALVAWSEGVSIADIAKELEISRDTIYRWIRESEKLLGKRLRRASNKLDARTKAQIIEAFILLKAPSMAALRKVLERYYFIRLSESQLRRSLEKWGLKSFQPSPLFESLSRDRMSILASVKNSGGATQAAESFLSELERSSPREP